VIVGTSLGGILAMLIGALRASVVAGIVLNDIGPEIDPVGRNRIAAYVGRTPPVASWNAAVAQSKATYGAALPDLSEAQWHSLARRSYVDVDGVPQLDIDPMIGEALRAAPVDTVPDLWPVFATLTTPRCLRSAACCRTCCPQRRLRACSARSRISSQSTSLGVATHRCLMSRNA